MKEKNLNAKSQAKVIIHELSSGSEESGQSRSNSTGLIDRVEGRRRGGRSYSFISI